MSFLWRFLGPDGATLDRPGPAHHSQSDAETWLGEQWRELADDGVAAVTLYDGDTALYGPMPLSDEPS